jgi:hypothetical protein
MLTIKQGLKISAIVDKMDLKITDPNGTQEQVGADMIMQSVRKAHKAEQEVYALVADIKGCTAAEAEKVDLVEFIKEVSNNAGIMDFFSSAVKQKGRE